MNNPNMLNLSVAQLRKGMTLAKPVYTTKNVLLMPAEKIIDDNVIHVLRWHAERNQIRPEIRVDRYAA